MQANDKKDFAILMTAIAELHYKKLTRPLLDIYWFALESYSLKDIQGAINKLILDPNVGQFMPKPADIVRVIDNDGQTKAMRAWSKVLNAIRSIGAWESIVFDDPIIHIVINEMGGWVYLCQSTIQELPFKLNEFEKRYVSYLNSNITNYPKKLMGRLEQSNACHESEPRLIANDTLKVLPPKNLIH